MDAPKSEKVPGGVDKNLYMAIFENCIDAIFISDKNSSFTDVNKAAETLTGYSKQELLKMSVSDLCDPMELNPYQKYSDRIMAGEAVIFEVDLRKKNGSHVFTEFSNKRIVIGNIPYIFIVAKDLTRSRLDEDSLRKAEQNLHCIINHSPDTIYVLDLVDHTCKYLNKEEFCGYSRSELEKNGSLLNLIYSDDKPAVLADWQEMLHSHNTMVTKEEFRLKRKDGKWEWIQQRGTVFSFMADGTPRQLLITLSIITERKQMEISLLSSEKQYRTLFNSIDEGFCIVEVIFGEIDKPLDYRFLEVNSSFEKQTGLIDAQGKRMRELVPLHEEYWFEIFGHIALTGEPMRFRRYAEQLHRWYEVYAFRYGDPKNRQIAILFNDITKNKDADEKLIISEFQLKEAQKTAHIGSWVYDVTSDKVLWSEEMYSIFEINPYDEQFTWLQHKTCIYESDWEKTDNAVQRAINEARPYEMEFRIIKPDNSLKWAYTIGKVEKDSNGKVLRLYGTVQDINERKTAEEKLKQSTEDYRKLVQHIEEGKENERRQIAHDLHDDLGQKLTAIRFDISWLKSRIGIQSGSVGNKLNEMEHLLIETMYSIKKISLRLRPSILDDLGLYETIEWQLVDFKKSTGIKYKAFLVPGEIEINKKISLTVFRIIQEALTNVVRHSGATEISLHLSSDKEKLKLIFTDNGKGIEDDQILNPESFGLIGMKERTKSCGGDLIIKKMTEKGTKIIVTIPIKCEK